MSSGRTSKSKGRSNNRVFLGGIGKEMEGTSSRQWHSPIKAPSNLNSKTKVLQKKKPKNNKRFDEVRSDEIVSLTDVVKMNFETIKLKGRFAPVLGEPYSPFYIMIYGLPYNGKSSTALLLADDLMKYHKLKALYVMNEEGVKGGLQDKVKRLGITSPIDVVESYLPQQFKGYDVVFIDSIQTANISVAEFQLLKKRFPHTSIVLVSKANKDGTFKGASDWAHDVDAVMEVKDRHVIMDKNRFPNHTKNSVKVF